MNRWLGFRARSLGLFASTLVVASVALVSLVSSPAAASVAPSSVASSGAAALATASPCVAGSKACPLRISFALGAYSAQRSSYLGGIHAERWFSVRARAGQTMVVVVAGAGPTRGTVYMPNGRQEGQPGGRVFDGSLPVTGTYRIRATESLMGEAWAGRVTVIVLVY